MVRELARRATFLALAAAIGFGLSTGMTATNTLPGSHATSFSKTLTANDLKPAACAGITVTNLVTGSGRVKGTTGNDLILGSPGNDDLGANAAGWGSDCCVGGGGTDNLRNSCVVSVP